MSSQETAATTRPRVMRDTRQQVAVVVAGAALVAGSVAVDLGHDAAFALAVFAAALVLALAASWRACLFAVPLLLLIESLVRRYVVNVVELVFVKDLVLAIAYAKYFRARRARGDRLLPRASVNFPIAGLALIVVAETFNPTLPSFVIGVLGIYIWLWYAPACWLVADAFDTPRQAVRAAAVYLAIFVPLGVLALIQQHVPVTNRSYYDTEVGSTEYVYRGRIIASRSVATFASTNAFGDYLVYIAVLLFALTLVVGSRRSRVGLAVALGAFILAVGGAANRSASGAAFISLITVLALHRRRDRASWTAITLGGALLLSFVLLPPVLPGLDRAGVTGFAPASLQERLSAHLYGPAEKILGVGHHGTPTTPETTTPTGTITTPAPSPAPAPVPNRPLGTDLTGLLGHGSGLGAGGLEHVTARLMSKQDEIRTSTLSGPEGGWADVLWELGVFGFIPLIGLIAIVIVDAFRTMRRTADGYIRSMAASAGAVVTCTAALMLVTSKLTHPIYSILFWFSVGLGVAASRFAKASSA